MRKSNKSNGAAVQNMQNLTQSILHWLRKE